MSVEELNAELHYRARSTPKNASRAGAVTLACVDCVSPDTAALALNMSRRGCDFARVLLLSHERPAVLPTGIDWVQIPELSFIGYQRFCLRELWKWTYTSHVLTIETDGWIIRPEQFNRDWLRYDYIGAPWPKVGYSAKTRVGNSGCCLRSRRLLCETARLSTDERIKHHYSHNLLVDVFTCYDLYDELTAAGIVYAPPEVAADFAIERPTEFGGGMGTSFAYHGKTGRSAVATEFLMGELPKWQRRTAWRNAGGRLRVGWNEYRAGTPERQAELDACREALETNPHIDDMVVISGRPTFQQMFDQLSDGSGETDVNVVLNSDCYLDHTAADLGCLQAGEFWCLTRHEVDPRGKWHLWDVPYSQDAWAWMGRCRVTGANFLPGTVGCDNALAYRAFAAGYHVGNPSRSIRISHLHAGEQRTQLKRHPGPYVVVWPHELLQQARWAMDLSPKRSGGPEVWRPK